MADTNPAQTLQEEATCPICLEYFNDPVFLDCDHSFCRSCVTQSWEGSRTVSCPQCRMACSRRNLKPNRQLRNIVEAARGLGFQSEREAETEGLCEKHKAPLKLFCKNDKVLICVLCEKSKQHRDHTVIPAEEDFREKIQAHLETLTEEREKLLGIKECREKKGEENLRITQTRRQKIVSEFQQLQQFLEEQERLLLAELEQLEQEMVKKQDENITKLSAEISRLSELISEMEGKYLKPTNEFLQDVRSTLSRCTEGIFPQPEEISPELEKGLGDFSRKTFALMEAVMTFKDTLPSILERKGSQVTVTLDPDTAHPDLVLSEDGKSVRRGYKRQNLSYTFDRFDTDPCVLGREGFTAGRRYWDVEVGGGRYWAVGVARESMERLGRINFSPKGGIWAVERSGNQFEALSSIVIPPPKIQFSRTIRVCLDCDRGQVTFFDAGDEAPIFTFPLGSVPGERLRPFFWVGPGSQLQLCP